MQHIFIGLLLTLVAVFLTRAQEVSTVGLRIERLRAQLRDMVDRESQLQEHGRLFEDDLRPENIERSVAAVGTADVAALRAHRCKQIKKQKADVDAQLSGVGAKRAALEVEIAAAEAEVVRLKAAALGADNAAPRPAPIAYWTEKLKLDRNDGLVIPASHPDVIIRTTDAEYESVVIAQGWASIYTRLPIERDWRHFGIRRVIAGRRYEREFVLRSMGLESTVIASGVNLTLFQPAEHKRCQTA